jgi:hypothetical protein
MSHETDQTKKSLIEQEEMKQGQGEAMRGGETAAVERSAKGAWMVIGGVWLLSFGLALFSFRQLKASTHFIERSVGNILQKGKMLDVTGCAEEVLRWNQRCDALQSLCVSSVRRLVGACLRARSRVEMCKSMDLGRSQGNFTFLRCQPKGLKREEKKACAYAYGAVWSYCQLTRRMERKGKAIPTLSVPSSR